MEARVWSTGWEASTAAKNLCRQQSSRAGARWPLAPHRLLGLRPNQRALQVVQLAVQSPKPTRDTDARGTARPAASTTQTVSCALVTAAPAPPACLSSKAAHNSRLAASQQRPAFGGSSSSSSLMQQQLTPVAARRIQSELNDWARNPPDGCCLESCEPMTHWTIVMSGPDPAAGMPRLYEGEVFRLSVRFTERYPLEPPEVTFLAHPPVHPHIYSNGHICLDILYDGPNGGWSPALTVNKLCLSLRSMLASNTDKRRPVGDTEYCSRVGGRSPKLTRWAFDDDKV